MPRRFKSLDGLRGIAAIVVVLFHINWSNHITETRFIDNGYLFVDLFFILSGFIITKTYGDRIHTIQETVGFLILRFFRLYPLHLAVLSVFLAIELAKLAAAHFGWNLNSFQDSKSGWTLGSNLLLIQSLTFSGPTWNVPSWSISSEAVVYVLFAGLVVAGCARWRHISFWALILAAISYAIVLRHAGSLFEINLGLLRCMAGFFVGAAISTIPESAVARFPSVILDAAMVMVLGAAIAVLSLSDGRLDILVVPVFALLIVLLQPDRGLSARLLASNPIAYLGRISYSVYMVHWLMLGVAGSVLKHSIGETAYYAGKYWQMYRVNMLWGDLGVALMLMLIILIASITYWTIEAPWRSFGRVVATRASTNMGRAGGTPSTNGTRPPGVPT
jgi:peptidoglycan/LPS O-acetylase OafA/YrhL